MRKVSRRNRNLVTGLMVGIASIFAVTYFLEVPGSDIADFFLATVLFFAGIVLMAIITVAVIKGIGRLLRKPDQGTDRSSE